jgi:hypothetical protein
VLPSSFGLHKYSLRSEISVDVFSSTLIFDGREQLDYVMEDVFITNQNEFSSYLIGIIFGSIQAKANIGVILN